MGDARGHLADRRQALASPGLVLEPSDLGHVLKRQEVAGRAIGRHQVRGAQANLAAASVGGAIGVVGALALGAAQFGIEQLGKLGRDLQDLGGAPSDRAMRRQGRDLLGRPVQADDASGAVGGDEAARQAFDDVLVERLQVGQRRGGHRQTVVGALQPLGQRSRTAAPRPQTRWRWPPRCRTPRGSAAGTAARRRSIRRRCSPIRPRTDAAPARCTAARSAARARRAPRRICTAAAPTIGSTYSSWK